VGHRCEEGGEGYEATHGVKNVDDAASPATAPAACVPTAR
jgi:hypothetical protein